MGEEPFFFAPWLLRRPPASDNRALNISTHIHTNTLSANYALLVFASSTPSAFSNRSAIDICYGVGDVVMLLR